MNAVVGTAFVIDDAALRRGLLGWCDAMTAAAPELNALDGRLGDGDLGTTLSRCAQLLRGALAAPADGRLQTTLKLAAQACAKASGSSFGTLLAVAFLSAAKGTADAAVLSRSTLAWLLGEVQTAIASRGGATLGDKTMLDSLAAIVAALAAANDSADGDALATAARAAAADALAQFKGRPNRIGRARMFAERSIGLDDPGMVAVLRMTEALVR